MTDKHIKNYDFAALMIINIACMAVSLAAAALLRFGTLDPGISFNYTSLLFKMAVIDVIINFVYDFNHHFYRRSTFREIRDVVLEQAVAILCIILWLYMIHDSEALPRRILFYYVTIDTCLLLVIRFIFREIMERIVRRTRSVSRLLILTTMDKADTVVGNITVYNEWYRKIVGVALLDDAPDEIGVYLQNPEEPAWGIRIVADRNSFMDYITHNEVDELFIADDRRQNMEYIMPWARTAEEMGISVNFDIDIFNWNIAGERDLGRVGKYAVVTFKRNVLSARELFAKRVLDIAGGLVGCVMLALMSIVVVPAIKLESPGPALFKQKRVGKNGRIFTLYKFRSMYQDAEERKAALMEQNEMQGLMFKMDNDPRITRVGSFIRKTSIDEFPQFINVLKGDMSLVGTRPPTVDEYKQYEARHKCRISMTPGITGMWQVSGRSEITDFDEVIRLDMAYIDNWTITKDIKILLKTVVVVLQRRGSE